MQRNLQECRFRFENKINIIIKKVIAQMRHPYVHILTSHRNLGTSCFRGYKLFSYIMLSDELGEKSGTTFTVLKLGAIAR